MELSFEVEQILASAFAYASSRHYELITPELILFIMCETGSFPHCFTACGGDLEALMINLSSYLNDYMDINSGEAPVFSDGTEKILAAARLSILGSGNDTIELSHLIRGLFTLEESYAVYYINSQGVEEVDLLQCIAEHSEYDYSEDEIPFDGEDSEEKKNTKMYESFAPCLNDTLEDNNPLIGREEEIERTIQILCRKEKNNPLHIGEPGVGKTAITYGLVELLRENKVPDALKGARVFALDLGGLVAGTQYRGDFEKRLKKLLDEIEKEEKPIIYIDEIHNLSGAGASSSGSLDASNMLKPYLAKGHIRFIGATTFDEYKKNFEKNKSMVRRFQNVEILEPSEDECVKILEGLKKNYEKYHGVKYAKGVLEYTVKMSQKYVTERFLPDKAIDILDEAGAYRKLHKLEQKQQTVSKSVIDIILTKICRVAVESVDNEKDTNIATLEKRILSKIFGQDEAVSQVVNAIKFSKAGLLVDNKPLSSLLFVGPTGVGKTEIAKSLAAELGVKLVRFDMSEYGEKHAIAKLIGAPAGYVGYEEGGLLTEEIRKNPSAVLLLDEIEKAHPDIFHVLLQVMDYATLTDNQGRKADFRRVVIIMTSNAGASQLGKPGMGFGKDEINTNAIEDEVKRIFQPEFRNRLNKIVVFNSMSDDMAKLITRKKLGDLAELLLSRKVDFTFSDKAVSLLCKEGISREYGAREIDRVIEGKIKPLFVDEILFGKLKKGGTCKLDVVKKDFVVKIGSSKKTL